MLTFEQKIGIVLTNARKEKNISQENLSRQSGIARRYLSDIENGRRAVSIQIFKNMADVLEIPLYRLVEKAENDDLGSAQPEMTPAERFGTVIRLLRIERKLTQKQLTDSARVPVNLIETGRNKISIDTIQKLAKALGLTSSELMDKVENGK